MLRTGCDGANAYASPVTGPRTDIAADPTNRTRARVCSPGRPVGTGCDGGIMRIAARV
jgi:hypothetical protein